MTKRRHVPFAFRLYVAGVTRNSEMARGNLATLCATLPPDQYTIEVVDVLQDPGRALEDGILMTPTLVRLWPRPLQSVVGTLGHTADLQQVLGIHAASE